MGFWGLAGWLLAVVVDKSGMTLFSVLWCCLPTCKFSHHKRSNSLRTRINKLSLSSWSHVGIGLPLASITAKRQCHVIIIMKSGTFQSLFCCLFHTLRIFTMLCRDNVLSYKFHYWAEDLLANLTSKSM